MVKQNADVVTLMDETAHTQSQTQQLLSPSVRGKTPQAAGYQTQERMKNMPKIAIDRTSFVVALVGYVLLFLISPVVVAILCSKEEIEDYIGIAFVVICMFSFGAIWFWAVLKLVFFTCLTENFISQRTLQGVKKSIGKK